MKTWLKVLLAVLILCAALILNFLDLLTFSDKFSSHPNLYGEAEKWRPAILVIRRLCFLALGPALIMGLFSKKVIYRIYLPIVFAVFAVLLSVGLSYLETNYSWRAYMVPQIKIEKLSKTLVGTNEFIGVRICNNTSYPLYNLSLVVSHAKSNEERTIPVLDEIGYDYKKISPQECFETKAMVPTGTSPDDINITYGGLH